MNEINNELVSIIIPMYNVANYFAETINSVIAQTYTNWEAICVNDLSTDNTLEVASSFAEKDSRIKVFTVEKNGGAAKARNFALERCTGRYIAYLDADDLWMPDKLEKQIAFLTANNYDACITGYETIEDDGTYRNTNQAPKKTTYKSMLKGPLTCTHCILFDTTKVSKELLVMPDVRAGQDFATWLNVVKHDHIIYGMPDILAKYRQHPKSISSNRVKALKRTWNIYRNVEHLNVFYSAYCFVPYTFKAINKRLHRKKK